MTLRRLFPRLVSGCLLLLAPGFARATPPAGPFAPDGRPDPGFQVPEELSLPYALAFALDNSFAIRAAQERIRQQEGVLLEVRAAGIPNVGAAANYTRLDREVSNSGDDRTWGLTITARQVLFSGGGVEASVRASRLALDAAVLQLQAVIDAVLLDVRTRFYDVLVSRERIRVQEQNVELLQRQLQDVRNRYEAGTVSNFEVLRAEVALANAQAPLISARNNHRIAIEELRRALGFTAADTASVARVPEFVGALEFTPTAVDLSSALASARERRPDLLRLRKLQEAATAGVAARRADLYPDLALAGSYGWNKAPFRDRFSEAREGWTLGLQSTWSLFDGRATRGRVAQAKSLLEQSRLAFEEAELAVTVEVRRALSSLQEASELAAASKRVVEQAEEAVRLADARYGAGTATQLDVLTARTDLTTARLNQLEAFYRFNVANASLRRAMGLPDEQVGAAR